MIKLSELSALEQAMTPGKWTLDEEDSASIGLGNLEVVVLGYDARRDDGPGICAMRNAMPVLLEIAKAAWAWAQATEAHRVALHNEHTAQIRYHSRHSDGMLERKPAWELSVDSTSRAISAVNHSESELRIAIGMAKP